LTVDLATDWKFVKGDVGPAAATGNWDAVTVPHTWNDHESQMDLLGNLKPGTPYFRGPCWYARTLNVPQAWNGQRVFIRFEAASIVAEVFLNGESIGAHRGAFTAFCFEITSRLQYGKDNELRVRVDNSNQADIPPLSGDFNMDGGIYRPVKLIVTNTQVLDIANPHPWNGRKDPYLYSVAVRVYRGGNVVDEVDQPLGLRTVAITQEQGFLLNGKPYPIRGVSRHQDRFNQGWALSAQDHQQDADIILGMGVTAVRNTHYPKAEPGTIWPIIAGC
jgi:beta-galactosidase/beta-glucuronidase